MLTIYIQSSHLYAPELLHVWDTIAEALDLKYTISNSAESADLKIGNKISDDIYAPEHYFDEIVKKSNYDFRSLFGDGPILMYEGHADYIATIYYLVNSAQEYNSTNVDVLGRFSYQGSFQDYFNNVTDNLVSDLIKKLCEKVTVLQSYSPYGRKSKFILSHDIDSLYGSFLQDGLWAVKNGRIDVISKLIIDACISNPAWFNIDKIMKIESEFDFKSTFFWLVNQGKINARETNSDYDISSAKLRNTLNLVEKNGFENGLHKSISSDSFNDEIQKLNREINANRNHYLKFSLPQHYRQVEASNLKVDASLGYAEHYGLRNNYGRPFKPFDIETRKEFSFIEAPLMIMDGTFHHYLQTPQSDVSSLIIAFFEKNAYGSVFGILWHNTFFTDYKYKGYLPIYKRILSYLYDSKFECILHRDLLNKN